MRLWIPIVASLLIVSMAAAQSGTLEIALAALPTNFDPHLAEDFAAEPVLGQVFEGLMELNAYMQLEPALASAYTVSEDGLLYTFSLRQGVLFHDGRLLTAQDVVASFDRVLDPATGSPSAWRFDQLVSVSALDTYTVEFQLASPFAPFPHHTAYVAVLPQEVPEEQVGGAQLPVVGTGPFLLVEDLADSHVLLAANPHYHRADLPRLDALRFQLVPEAADRLAGLLAGEYQLLPEVDPVGAERLASEDGLSSETSVLLLGVPDLGYAFLGMNLRHPALADLRSRQALNLALDRVELVEVVYDGDAVPGGPLSPALSDWALAASEYACFIPDPEAAHELMAQAGWPDGLEIDLLVMASEPQAVALAQAATERWAAAGIQATLSAETADRYLRRLQDGDFQVFVGWAQGGPDPDGALSSSFHSDGASNVFGYRDPAVDAMLDEARGTGDFATRQDLYARLQLELACDGPIIPVAYPTIFSAHRETVQGFVQMPTRGLRYLRDVWLD